MNATPDNENDRIEELLASVSLTDPSPRLDRRMENVFQLPRRRFIGPLTGFAAGVLVTISIMRSLPASPKTPVAPPTPVQPVANESKRIVTVCATPHQAIDEIDGTIAGVPVRLERRRTQIEVRPTSNSNGDWRAAVNLPDVVTIRSIQPN